MKCGKSWDGKPPNQNDDMNKTDYADYVQSVARFLKLNNIKPGCYSPATENSEPFFSWSPCHCCHNSNGGNRETYRFAMLSGEMFNADICADCVYYLAYGKLDDMTMMEMAETP
jgi:hypothetical protein